MTCSPSCLANGKSSSKWFSYYGLLIIMTSGQNTDHLISLCISRAIDSHRLCSATNPPAHLCISVSALIKSCNPAQLPHHPPNHNVLCFPLFCFFFLLLHPDWIINVLISLYCTLIPSADRRCLTCIQCRVTDDFRGCLERSYRCRV